MLNISNVLSVAFTLRMSAKDWQERALASLKDFFRVHGNIRKEGGTKPTSAKREGGVFMPSTVNCGLEEIYGGLCSNEFMTFSASQDEVDGQVVLRFMLCPMREIEWENRRPFHEMQKACGEACVMACYRAMVYDHQYIKEGQEPDDMRAISINGDQPNWLLHPNGKPILRGNEPKKPHVQLLIEEDGELVAA